MSASGRTKVASDVKFGMEASFIELYLWSKFGYSALIRFENMGLRYTRKVFNARAQRSWRRRLWDSMRTPSPSS